MYRERRVPPGEAQRILARAIELQRAEGGGHDMSDEEIARTLGDLGIEERFVTQAMHDDGADPAAVAVASSWFIGSPLRLTFERRVARNVVTDDHARIVDAIRRASGHRGQTEIIGDEITWTTRPIRRRANVSGTRVIVSPSASGTKIRVEADLRGAAGGIFGGLLGALGVNALLWSVLIPLVFHGPALLSAAHVTFVIALYAVLRVAFGAFVQRRRRLLGEIAAKVAAVAASEDARPAMVRVEDVARPRVEAPVASEPEAVDDAALTNRSRAAR